MNKSKSKKNKQTSSIWGGRFIKDSSEIMKNINASIWFDNRLAFHDIVLSKEHSNMLYKQKIISHKENRIIQKGLKQIESEMINDQFYFSDELEDIHMHIEARLIELIGDTGKKLHTARSRNDQVATSFKMWVRDELDTLLILIKNLQASIIKQAEAHINTILPGFTHLQPAQPISLAHHLLAYVEMLGRDITRLEDAKNRLNKSPLGAAALAGTSFPIDRFYTAKALGFDNPMENSIDAVSDRDFVLEVLSNASIIMVHLSRLAEELVIWSSPGFNFIALPDSFSTGSSIMPQKRNPDAAELIRGKTGRVSSAFYNVLTMLKGLPLAYSKDMQEDKEPFFDAIDNLKLCLSVSEGLIKEISFNVDEMKKMAELGYITATDIADWLVKECNIPFRDAHSITGRVVKYAEKNNLTLEEVSLNEFKKIDKRINNNILKVLTLKNSLESRNSYGGTAPKLVKKALKKAKIKWLK